MGHNVNLCEMVGAPAELECPKCGDVADSWFDDYDIDCRNANPAPGQWRLMAHCAECEHKWTHEMALVPVPLATCGDGVVQLADEELIAAGVLRVVELEQRVGLLREAAIAGRNALYDHAPRVYGPGDRWAALDEAIGALVTLYPGWETAVRNAPTSEEREEGLALVAMAREAAQWKRMATRLRRSVGTHDCGGGPHSCGGCCVCMQQQEHGALDGLTLELAAAEGRAGGLEWLLNEANAKRLNAVSAARRWKRRARRRAAAAQKADQRAGWARAALVEVTKP